MIVPTTERGAYYAERSWFTGEDRRALEVVVKSLAGMLISVFMVNPIAALAVTPAAHASPDPRNPSDQQIVTTESRKVRCIVEPEQVLCTGDFANAPIDYGPPDSPFDRGYPNNTVWTQADGGGLHWNSSNLPSTGYAESKFDLVLSYGRVFHLKGWTVEPRSTGTQFINDGTGHGMFVSIESVRPV